MWEFVDKGIGLGDRFDNAIWGEVKYDFPITHPLFGSLPNVRKTMNDMATLMGGDDKAMDLRNFNHAQRQRFKNDTSMAGYRLVGNLFKTLGTFTGIPKSDLPQKVVRVIDRNSERSK